MKLEMKAKAAAAAQARKKSLTQDGPDGAGCDSPIFALVDSDGSVGVDISGSGASCNWEAGYDTDESLDEVVEEDDTLEAQKVMQRDLVSHRSVVIEVCLVLAVFIGMGMWAIKTH